MKSPYYLVLIMLLFLNSCKTKEDSGSFTIEVPIAKKITKELSIHGDTRIDNYFWMRLSDQQKNASEPDAQTQDVLNYLNAENSYLKTVMSHTESLQDTLYKEITGRIKQDDQSVPVKDNGYEYYTRFEEGNDYALFCRKKNGTNLESI